MPIRPENRHHYGKAWRELRKAILKRAVDRCECTGECGDEHNDDWTEHGGAIHRSCGAPNGMKISRETRNPASWAPASWVGTRLPCDPFDAKEIRVILTIAHLNHKEGDDRPENLKALCQRCHLRLDRDQHKATAARTRHAKQGPMLPLGD